ncbi:C4-dicarboxylate ABC transporter substrate-binding protein [Methanocella sp. CWC-04]|uniref:C4-dicarboxylate ABC transporter substrate-binding protein n=1 Tax=Methanooceanicella nereidis TaxID=2052831 RepID=A0AAP2W5T3_9EURY|nr:TAXI family TRAP transporter solute-binding subunit [Methanocella sp. CWC-04]MCD1293654.1 C4-dicarboxylate ABC transporter substrate-binding protein [Methanocella sp. CWC-04]
MFKIDRSMKILLVISMLLVSMCALGCTQPETETKQYTIATGGTAGTYYPIGGGIAQTVNNASLGFILSVESTGASVANCRLVNDKEADFATVQNDVAYSAINGQRDFAAGKLENLQGVACLYPETIQVIVLKDSGIKSIGDLKGKRVVVGDKGSGSEFNALEILAAYGLTKDDIVVDNSKLSQAAELLKNGQADAAFWTGGAPTAAISELATTHDIYIVPISGEARDKLMAESPFYATETLKAGTYNNLNEDIETVSVMAMLIANKDIPADDVYNLLKAMYDPNAPLKNAHAMASKITTETALKGMSIPLHPGAQKYFDEKGIKA